MELENREERIVRTIEGGMSLSLDAAAIQQWSHAERQEGRGCEGGVQK